MSDEIIDEEMEIMNEPAKTSKPFDSHTFMRPVKDLNFPAPVMLDIEETVQDAIMFMQVKQFGCVLITEKHQLVGILTERDIIAKAIGDDKDFHSQKVRDIMTPNPEAFQSDDSLGFIMKAMTVGGYRHVPIVDADNTPVGIISVRDIIAFIVEHFPEEVLNLPPKPMRLTKEREGA
ncbi:MAG TPA: CBS domain-containing protein [Bacteroidota bacterium]|nr:CBS domain-containing protein [Bacteroidota bacterium]